MRVIVTGGAGYLGRAIVHALAARGHDPVVFARHATRAGLPGRAHDGDVRDRTAFAAAARGSEAIVHAAALVSIWRRDPTEFDDINVGGLANAIAITRELGIARLIYISSFVARPPGGRSRAIAANDYQRTKILADDLARRSRDSGLPIVITYPGVLYGPGPPNESNILGRLLDDYVHGRLPGLVGGNRIWSFAWVEDVAAAHVAALEHPRPAPSYALGGENAPHKRPFAIAARRLGRPEPRSVPLWLARLAAVRDEWRARATGEAPRLTRGALEIFKHDWPVDHDQAARDLAYRVSSLDTRMETLLSAWPAPNRST